MNNESLDLNKQRILVVGQQWQAQALIELFKTKHPNWHIDLQASLQESNKSNPNRSTKRLQLICWIQQDPLASNALNEELKQWGLREPGTPLILIINNSKNYQQDLLLKLKVEGLLEQPSLAEISEAMELVLKGGRVFRINQEENSNNTRAYNNQKSPYNQGLGCSLLNSGLMQVEREINRILQIIATERGSGLFTFVMYGRLRELRMARKILHFIWGGSSENVQIENHESKENLHIWLPQRGGINLLGQLQLNLANSCKDLVAGESNQLLALEALLPERRQNLFECLLNEFKILVEKISLEKTNMESSVVDLWLNQQLLLRQRALLQLVGPYTQMPKEGSLVRLADTLLQTSNLQDEDPDLCSLYPILMALIDGKPLLINGQLMAPDQPYALLHLQSLLSNWLLRSAERIAKEVLEACSGWPELRRTMLPTKFLPTRELDRLRNRLNSIERWQSLFVRPVAIYESKRTLYTIRAGKWCSQVLIEPRDHELKTLSWWQQTITILLEARDALAPQLEILINRIGTLMVLLLTRVLGRAIGLIGRGIMQGLGKGIQNSALSGDKL